MERAGRKSRLFRLRTIEVCIILALGLTFGFLIYLSAAHPKPWTSFVADQDHDGFRDVARHETADECVQHIHSLGVDGVCGFECNRLSRCVNTIRVFAETTDQKVPSMAAAD